MSKKLAIVCLPPLRVTLTFHDDLRHRLDHAQRGHGHAGVIVGLADVGQLQDVSADGHVVLGRQVFRPQHPLDVWHGGAHGHAGDVDVAPRHDLAVCRGDGEARGNPAHWSGAQLGRGH